MKQLDYLMSVVMPIYNVEEYLVEAIDSVINQTIGFCGNVQLILVNDGSPDNSADICKRYEAMYPENIIYVEKENGGVSSARNAGIKYAKGRYINFLDADDAWASDAFAVIAEFFRENNNVKIAAARPEYFGRSDGNKSPLDYVYKKSQIIDIFETTDLPLFGLNRAFFETEIVRGHQFDTEVSFSEDQLFLTNLVLDQKSFGIVRGAVYRYRKREDNSSALDKAKSTPSYYTVTPEKVFRAIVNRSIKEYGEVIPYVQSLMITNLKFRARPVPDGVLTDIELRNYRDVMHSILESISDDIVMEQKGLLFWQRIYYLNAKYNGEMPESVVSKLINGKLRLQIDELITDGAIMLSGIAHEKWINTDIVIVAEDERGKQYNFDYTENSESDKGGPFEGYNLKGYKHSVSLPMRDGAVYTFYIYAGKDLRERIRPRFGNGVAFSDDKKTVIEAGKNIITISGGNLYSGKEKNKYASRLAEEAGIPYEDAYEEMKQTKWATGLSFADYLKNGLHGMDEHVRFRTAEKIERRKERRGEYIEDISRYLNKNPKEVRSEIRRLRQLYKETFSISTGFYHDYELYKRDEVSVEESVTLLAERKALCTHFREIFDDTEDYITCIAELESIYVKIKEINSKLLTQTIIDKHHEDFSVRYPQMKEDADIEREIILDFMTLQNAAGYSNTDYKIYDLYPKKFREKMSYASNREVARMVRGFNAPEARSVLDDKYGCYKRFRKYFGRKMVPVKSSEDIEKIKKFCIKNKTFVKKPVYSKQGHGIRLVDRNDYKTTKGMVKSLLKEDGEFIAEEVVKGHPLTASFNVDSLNTLRIVTLNTRTKVRGIGLMSKAVRNGVILYAGQGIYCCAAFFKTGRKDSFVDNAGAGGCFTAIDLKTGKSSGLAVGEDGLEYTVHPDSGISFRSLRFESINNVVKTAKELALMIPEAGIVGWDFALTEGDEWVLIEANYSPTFIGQAPAKCGIGREIHRMLSLPVIRDKEKAVERETVEQIEDNA